jgi:hypothetical protein
MTISEITSRLADSGIKLSPWKLRRKIDTYINQPTRNHYNNRRDITNEEYYKLAIAVAIELKTSLPSKNVKEYLTGVKSKTDLLTFIVDSSKIDILLKEWIEK